MISSAFPPSSSQVKILEAKSRQLAAYKRLCRGITPSVNRFGHLPESPLRDIEEQQERMKQQDPNRTVLVVAASTEEEKEEDAEIVEAARQCTEAEAVVAKEEKEIHAEEEKIHAAVAAAAVQEKAAAMAHQEQEQEQVVLIVLEKHSVIEKIERQIDELRRHMEHLAASRASNESKQADCLHELDGLSRAIEYFTQKRDEAIESPETGGTLHADANADAAAAAAAAASDTAGFYKAKLLKFHQGCLAEFTKVCSLRRYDMDCLRVEFGVIDRYQNENSAELANANTRLQSIQEDIEQLQNSIQEMDERMTAIKAFKAAYLQAAEAARLRSAEARQRAEAAKATLLQAKAAEATLLQAKAAKARQRAEAEEAERMRAEYISLLVRDTLNNVARQLAAEEAARLQAEAEAAARQQAEAEAAAQQQLKAIAALVASMDPCFANMCASLKTENTIGDILVLMTSQADPQADPQPTSLAVPQPTSDVSQPTPLVDPQPTPHNVSQDVSQDVLQHDAPAEPVIPLPAAGNGVVEDVYSEEEIDTDTLKSSQPSKLDKVQLTAPTMPKLSVSNQDVRYAPELSRQMASSDGTSSLVLRAPELSRQTAGSDGTFSLVLRRNNQGVMPRSSEEPYQSKYLKNIRGVIDKIHKLYEDRFDDDIARLQELMTQFEGHDRNRDKHWRLITADEGYIAKFSETIATMTTIFGSGRPIPLTIFLNTAFKPTVSALLGYILVCEALVPITVSHKPDTSAANTMQVSIISNSGHVNALHGINPPSSSRSSVMSSALQVLPCSSPSSALPVIPCSSRSSALQVIPCSSPSLAMVVQNSSNSTLLTVNPKRERATNSECNRVIENSKFIKGSYAAQVPKEWFDRLMKLLNSSDEDNTQLRLASINASVCSPELHNLLSNLLRRPHDTLNLTQFSDSVQESILALQNVLRQITSYDYTLPPWIPFSVKLDCERKSDWEIRTMASAYTYHRRNQSKLYGFMCHYMHCMTACIENKPIIESIAKLVAKLQGFINATKSGEMHRQAMDVLSEEYQAILKLPAEDATVLKTLLTMGITRAEVDAALRPLPEFRRGCFETRLSFSQLRRDGQKRSSMYYPLILSGSDLEHRERNLINSNNLVESGAANYTLIAHTEPTALAKHILSESMKCRIPVHSSHFDPDTRRSIVVLLLWIGSDPEKWFAALKWLSAFLAGKVYLTALVITNDGVEYPCPHKTPSTSLRIEQVMKRTVQCNAVVFVGNPFAYTEIHVDTEDQYTSLMKALFEPMFEGGSIDAATSTPSLKKQSLKKQLANFRQEEANEKAKIDEQRRFQETLAKAKALEALQRKLAHRTVVRFSCQCTIDIDIVSGEITGKHQVIQCKLDDIAHITGALPMLLNHKGVAGKLDLSCGCSVSEDNEMPFTQSAECKHDQNSHIFELLTLLATIDIKLIDPVSIPFGLSCGCSAARNPDNPSVVIPNYCDHVITDLSHFAVLDNLIDKIAPPQTVDTSVSQDCLPRPCGCNAVRSEKTGKLEYSEGKHCVVWGDVGEHKKEVIEMARRLLSASAASSAVALSAGLHEPSAAATAPASSTVAPSAAPSAAATAKPPASSTVEPSAANKSCGCYAKLSDSGDWTYYKFHLCNNRAKNHRITVIGLEMARHAEQLAAAAAAAAAPKKAAKKSP